MASFLHATDLHFGKPHNSVGIGKSLAKGVMPPARSLRTWMATHDRDVTAALTELIVELEDELDAVVLTGDIATTSSNSALGQACAWLADTRAKARKPRIIALPGNHDRFHPVPSVPPIPPYQPGATAFDTTLGALPGIEVPAPVHGVGVVSLDDTCLIACVDLTLRHASEKTHSQGRCAQGIVRRAKDVTEAIDAARTPETTHVVVATHFPLDPLPANMGAHECIDGVALLAELVHLARTVPVLVISGHLHREYRYRDADLFRFVGATTSQTLHPAAERTARPADLTEPGAHAAATVRTEPGGFVVTRWRYGTDVTLGLTPPAKRFCEPTEVHFP